MDGDDIKEVNQDDNQESEQEGHSNVFPLWYIRKLNENRKPAKLVEMDRDEMDFFG